MAELVPLRRNRDFVLLQTGQALSTVGSEAGAVAYTLLVLSLTHSPAKAGFVGFVRLAPWPLFALPAGVAVDRWNRKHLMIVSDVVRVITVGLLGVTIAAGHVTLALISIVAFVEGTMYVLFNIAEIGAVRSVVASEQLPRAFATEQARLSSVYLVGPPLGGFLFGLGRSLPFIVDSITYAFSTGTLLAMRTPFQEERDVTVQAKMRAEIKEGFSLGGSTATGLPVGWGVVAVDPSVIPLGTRMTIPGYGEGVAADVGSGISGAAIDLWFPSDIVGAFSAFSALRSRRSASRAQRRDYLL